MENERSLRIWESNNRQIFSHPKIIICFFNNGNPPEVIKQMEKMVFNFLLKGPDKVTRLSVINTLDKGGLNLRDFESHIKALRLPQIQLKKLWRVFSF